MSIFAIGDLHLSFAPGSDKPMDVFGSRWYNHEERIKEDWLKSVGEDDTVVIAGDVSWGLKQEEAAYDLRWIDALPGKKILIKGNHDLWWTGINRLNRTYESMLFLQNNFALVEDCCICGSRGWITPGDDDFGEPDMKVYKRECLRLEASLKAAAEKAPGREILCFLHYPPSSGRDYFSGFQQLFEDYGVREVYYGHIHGESGFAAAMQGEFYGSRYSLISADYLNCRLLRVR